MSERHAFPSRRQRGCPGLRPEFYPAFMRDLVDFDYAESLPEEARIWLAAFAEEYYRGWRLKNETQLHQLPDLRAADAARKRQTRALGDGVKLVELDESLESASATESEILSLLDRRRVQQRASEQARSGAERANAADASSSPGSAARCA